jgi:hypothetical protein
MRLHKNFNSDILHFEFILGESLASSTIIWCTCASLFPASGF